MSPASDDDTRLRALEQLVATLQERSADSDELEKRVREVEAWKDGVVGGAKTATFLARGFWAVVAGAGGAAALFVWQMLTGPKP